MFVVCCVACRCFFCFLSLSVSLFVKLLSVSVFLGVAGFKGKPTFARLPSSGAPDFDPYPNVLRRYASYTARLAKYEAYSEHLVFGVPAVGPQDLSRAHALLKVHHKVHGLSGGVRQESTIEIPSPFRAISGR